MDATKQHSQFKVYFATLKRKNTVSSYYDYEKYNYEKEPSLVRISQYSPFNYKLNELRVM